MDKPDYRALDDFEHSAGRPPNTRHTL